MAVMRAVILAIVVTVTIAGGSGTITHATPLGQTALLPGDPGYANTDPGDPGFPPDE